MDTKEIELSVIIPVYNEVGVIGESVKKILALGLAKSEIIVVDDGSSDGSGDAALAAGATRVIRHPYNIGNGGAVKTGIRAANGETLIMLDGDGQHDPEDIKRFLPYLVDYHMVIGARSRDSHATWHRKIANLFYNAFASYVAQFKIEDLTSGFRAMRRRDALRFVDMLPNSFSYPTTSTLVFLRSGRAIKYLPIIAARRVGVSKIRILTDGPRFFMIIIKIAMIFAPLRVFLPVSAILFLLALAWYLYTYINFGTFTNMSALVFNSSVIVFMLGLIAEQIAAMRMEDRGK